MVNVISIPKTEEIRTEMSVALQLATHRSVIWTSTRSKWKRLIGLMKYFKFNYEILAIPRESLLKFMWSSRFLNHILRNFILCTGFIPKLYLIYKFNLSFFFVLIKCELITNILNYFSVFFYYYIDRFFVRNICC